MKKLSNLDRFRFIKYSKGPEGLFRFIGRTAALRLELIKIHNSNLQRSLTLTS